MTYETFTVDIDSDGIALVTIDLPGQSMNVWNEALMNDFKAFVEDFISNDDIKEWNQLSEKIHAHYVKAEPPVRSKIVAKVDECPAADPDDDAKEAGLDFSGSTVLDVAHRLLAGTGSLGTPRFYVLLEDSAGDTHILDIKQQLPPSGYGYVSFDTLEWLGEPRDFNLQLDHRAGQFGTLAVSNA